MSNPKWFKCEWIWRKNKASGFLNAKFMPLRNHESVVVFGRGRTVYNPQMTTGHKPVNSFTKRTSDGDTMGKTRKGISGGGQTTRYPKTVLEIPVVNQDGTSPEGKYHPTQKPVALMEYLIKTYTNPGQLVLDNTMGSGTTGVACVNTNRRFIGIERDETYFKIAQKRIEKARLASQVDISSPSVKIQNDPLASLQ